MVTLIICIHIQTVHLGFTGLSALDVILSVYCVGTESAMQLLSNCRTTFLLHIMANPADSSRKVAKDLQRAAGVLMDMQSKGELDPSARGRPPAAFGAGGPM